MNDIFIHEPDLRDKLIGIILGYGSDQSQSLFENLSKDIKFFEMNQLSESPEAQIKIIYNINNL